MTETNLHLRTESQSTAAHVWAGLLIMCAIAAFWHAWLDVFSIATHDPESSHLFLVPLLAIWLASDAAPEYRGLRHGNSVWGMLLIILSVVLYQIGLRDQLQFVWHLSAVMCLIGILVMLFSQTWVARHWPAVVILLALVPVPGAIRQQLARPLQWLSAVSCEQILSVLGYGVTRHGCLLELNGMQVAVAEACNGMRMANSLMLVTYAACFAFRMSHRRRLLLLALSPLLAVVLNLVRLLLTVVCYARLSEHTAETMHDVLGWVFPVLAFLCVLAIRDQPSVDNISPAYRTAPMSQNRLDHCVVVVLLVVLAISHRTLFPRRAQVLKMHETICELLEKTPWLVDEYVAKNAADLRDDVQSLLNPLTTVRRYYRDPETGNRVLLVAVACRQARDLIGHHPGICLPSQGWQPLTAETVEWCLQGESIAGRIYSFERFCPTGPVQTRVTSLLVTAGRFPGGDPDEINEAAGDYRRNCFGAMTIQLQTLDVVDEEQWRKTSGKFVRQFAPALRAYRMAGRMAGRGSIGEIQAVSGQQRQQRSRSFCQRAASLLPFVRVF